MMESSWLSSEGVTGGHVFAQRKNYTFAQQKPKTNQWK